MLTHRLSENKLMNTEKNHAAKAIDVQRLVRLWRTREKTLTSAGMMDLPPRLKRELQSLGDAYGQCAEELENPPTELLDALGIEANGSDWHK